MIGGIYVVGLKNITFQIEGTIRFDSNRNTWPTDASGKVRECIYMKDIENVIFTSSGIGTIDGNGKEWWGAIKFLLFPKNRPRMIHIVGSKNVLMENLLLKDSPCWTLYAEKSNGLLIRYTDVDARWTDQHAHNLLDLQAFNTDGFDVTGTNVHIHDCNIWNQDDCISVKDGSSNMLFERISCSGVGLVIGSIGSSRNHNITFRDCVLPRTFKGIYLKTRWYDGPPIGDEASITDILFENITMYSPQQFGIWIGPAQQVGNPCSLLWPYVPGQECLMSGYQTWRNITLRNIYIHNPVHGPGVLMGNTTNPMQNIVFENVVVMNQGDTPFGDNYYCEGMEGIDGYVSGATTPVPPCFPFKKPLNVDAQFLEIY
eukprot:CAMPEP_0176430566 /NCGR_PEP_ID=MMETSP0127-20121128/14325_1 /TAXON_ID=938130 /ORGANISM="Platyophrya macrostoma, Strain WH" /LENGTH=371 /DNA_ID=CAMNT_0017812471 /DNA_START=209 /DNA_END=1324 /DNA_ORIENTATION=-